MRTYNNGPPPNPRPSATPANNQQNALSGPNTGNQQLPVTRSRLNTFNLARYNAAHERRSANTPGYWRFHEWARQAAFNPTYEEEPEGSHQSTRSAPSESATSTNSQHATAGAGSSTSEEKVSNEQPREEERSAQAQQDPDVPPGFRWVHIEIVDADQLTDD